MAPSQPRAKVVAASPQAYVLRVRAGEPRDFLVPSDGRVTLDFPSHQAGCGVYLFNKLRIHRTANPFTDKSIDLVLGGKIKRHLSMKEIQELPRDAQDYHLLTVRAAK